MKFTWLWNYLFGGVPKQRVRVSHVARELVRATEQDQTIDLAAQLAFWVILAMFPFAMFLLTLIGFVPISGIDQEITAMTYRAMPEEAARLTDQAMHEILGQQRGWLLLVSLVGALWSASGGISAAITALNRAYRVHETRPWWRIKLVSMATTLGAAVLIIVSMVGLLVGPELVRNISIRFGLQTAFDLIWGWVRWPLVVASMMALLAWVYYLLPNVRQKFRLLSPGSIIAVLLWIISSLVFKFYVSHFNSYAKTYGTLGGAIVLLIWVYLSSVWVILGGEINALLDRMVLGIRHTERFSGPITQTDRGVPKDRDREIAA